MERVAAHSELESPRRDRDEATVRDPTAGRCNRRGVDTGRTRKAGGTGRAPTRRSSTIQIVAQLSAESSARPTDTARFVDAVIFNWATGGTDGHAKNYSILLRGEEVRLAPLYDLMTEIPYLSPGAEVSALATAMRVGEDYTLAAADHRDAWERFAGRLRLNAAQVVERAALILDLCPAAFGTVIAGLDPADQQSPRLATLVDDLQQRRDAVLSRLRGANASQPSSRSGTHPGAARSQTPQPSSRSSPSSQLSPPPAGETPQATASRSVICGAPTGVDRSCRRTLVSAPCPTHPNSSGSKKIKSRAKRPRRYPPTTGGAGSAAAAVCGPAPRHGPHAPHSSGRSSLASRRGGCQLLWHGRVVDDGLADVGLVVGGEHLEHF